MNEIFNYLSSHYPEIVVSGIALPSVGFVINKYWRKQNKGKITGTFETKLASVTPTNSGNNIAGANNIAGTNSVINVFNSSPKELDQELEKVPDNFRAKVSILFIDDDTKFKVISILKQAGWTQTKIIKDLKSWNDTSLLNAHIVFIDIQGVGKALQYPDEGLGLSASIKEKYPKKKLIIYSADSDGNRFHKAFRLADDQISKNAIPYEFEVVIETMANELARNGLL